MARHNRVGRGTDQCGADYVISYQPDWLQQVKVTRTLENGRQSTKTLFRNTGGRSVPPGSKVKTRIASRKESLEFEIDVSDPHGVVKRIVVETDPGEDGDGGRDGGRIQFTINDGKRARKARKPASRKASTP
jgi:hypothetical protein